MTYRLATTLLLATLTPGALTGCQPKGDLGEYTASDSSESDAESGATSSVTTGNTGNTGTGEPSTGEPGTTGSEETGSEETGDPGCAAPEQDFQASFEATLDPPLPFEVTKFSANCTVDTLTVEPNFVTVALDCVERSVTLEFTVSTGFTPLFAEGDTLALTYHRSTPFWINQWFTLRTTNPDSSVLLGGVNADALLPLDDDDATLFSPVQLKVQEGVCAAPIDCNNPFEQLALEVSYDQDTQQLVPGNSTLVGTLTSTRVDLRTANRSIDMDCGISDVPPEWFSALLILLPEG